LAKLSNSISASSEDEDGRGKQEKEKGDHWLVEAMSRGRLGGREDVVGEQGTEANESDDLEDKTGK
jgi:cell division protein FtsI/penicillin-binding protein 2